MKARIPPKKKAIPPGIVLDFSPDERKKAAVTFKKTWEQLKNLLANKVFSYDQTERALQTDFLKQFDDLFQSIGKTVLSTELKDVFSSYTVGRGTILGVDEVVSYCRFIPIANFIKHDNRFSPEGVEWLYLAIGSNNETIKHCSESECNAQKSDRFGFCHFSLNTECGDVKIVDLTKFADENYDDFNNQLVSSIQRYKKSEEQIRYGIRMWGLKTYSTMLSEEIFVPIEDSQKKVEYTPFQTMAKYFEKQGFGGIIYKSTKYQYAKKLVLFDKIYANPFDSIDDYFIS